MKYKYIIGILIIFLTSLACAAIIGWANKCSVDTQIIIFEINLWGMFNYCFQNYDKNN